MKLSYSNEERTVIQVQLEEGEILGNFAGPVTMFVPNDPANREFADIQEQQHEIDDYQAPATPKTESL